MDSHWCFCIQYAVIRCFGSSAWRNLASHIHVAGKGIWIAFSNNYEYSFLILHQRSGFLKAEMCNLKPHQQTFPICYIKIQDVYLTHFEWIIYQRMILFPHVLLIWRILGSLIYADLPNVHPFHCVVCKKKYPEKHPICYYHRSH